MEAVLGKGWEKHVEGQKLKQDGDAFRSKLNTQQLFEDWKKRVESRQQAVQGRIFNIVSSRTRSGTILKLQVNFAPETITLAKEVCINVHFESFRVSTSKKWTYMYMYMYSLAEYCQRLRFIFASTCCLYFMYMQMCIGLHYVAYRLQNNVLAHVIIWMSICTSGVVHSYNVHLFM